MKDAGEVIDMLDRGVMKDLRFVSFSFTNDDSGLMLLGISFALSKQYSDAISSNVIRGNERRAEEGKYLATAPHGYIKDDNGRLRPDDDSYEIISQGFRMRLEGATLQSVANFLSESDYTYLVGKTRKRTKFTKNKVTNIFKNPVYAGVMLHADKIALDLCDFYDFMPVVNVDEFLAINKHSTESIIKRIQRSLGSYSRRADLLAGLVYCSECLQPTVPAITTKWDREKTRIVSRYFYYKCHTKSCSRKGKSTRAKVIISFVKEFLAKRPFSNRSTYNHYKKETERVSKERAKKARDRKHKIVAALRRFESESADIRSTLAGERNKELIKGLRGDHDVIAKNIQTLEKEMQSCEKVIQAEKMVPLTFKKFVELFDNMATQMGGIENMNDLDFVIRKIFSNFYVDGKKVDSARLCEPFSTLNVDEVLLGGR